MGEAAPARPPLGLTDLPTELLVDIIERLPARARQYARLSRCSKTYHHRFQPMLWADTRAQTVAIKRGCSKTGRTDLIRKALSCGHSASLIKGQPFRRRNIETGLEEGPILWWRGALTLVLAAQEDNHEALEVLIESGAQLFPTPELDEQTREAQLYIFMKYIKISARGNGKVMSLAYRHGLHRQIIESGQLHKDYSHPLVALVEGGAPVDVLRACLESGADINGPQRSSSREPIGDESRDLLSPLSAAVLANNPEIFEFLMSQGADINGPSVEGTNRALHIPVFAAALRMTTDKDGRAMMRRCLDHGADINQIGSLNLYWRYHRHYYASAPLAGRWFKGSIIHLFLSAITTLSNANPGPVPREELEWLLRRGAAVRLPETRGQLGRLGVRPLHRSGEEIYISPFEFFIRKWLAKPLLKSAYGPGLLESLLQNGAARGEAAYVIDYIACKYTPAYRVRMEKDERECQEKLARRLLEELTEGEPGPSFWPPAWPLERPFKTQQDVVTRGR